ncbi:MAG: rod shape-determining protein MreC [Gammaproteobacteria bacterium]
MNTLFTRTTPSPSLAIVLILTCALTLWIDSSSDYLRGFRQATSPWIEPVIGMAHLPLRLSSGVSDTFQTIVDRGERVDALEAENFELRALASRMAGLVAENARLRALLGSSSQIESDALIAEVLSLEQRSDRHRLILDKGERDGVRVGQAVIDSTGLLGQVTEVMPGLSKVMLVTDPSHAVPMLNERTGQQVIAEGTGDRQQLSVRFISVSADIRLGDSLVTSGLGRRFPRGYPVGQISNIKMIPGESFQSVDMSISSKPHAIDHVLLLSLVEPLVQEDAVTKAAEAPKTSETSEEAGVL